MKPIGRVSLITTFDRLLARGFVSITVYSITSFSSTSTDVVVFVKANVSSSILILALAVFELALSSAATTFAVLISSLSPFLIDITMAV